MSLINNANNIVQSITQTAIKSSRNLAGKLTTLLPSKATSTALALSALATLASASKSNADIVFNAVELDGTFAQPSLQNASSLSYGAQPFVVTSDLVNSDGIEYNGAFATNFVNLPNSTQTGLDVRSWDVGFIDLSTATDAVNGTPTARFEFNPLESTAPNGMQFQDLIIQTAGPNGEEHHTFIDVANLGQSLDNNPYHQITEVINMDSELTLQDNSTMTLANFLAEHTGDILYFSSVLSNGASDGLYEIAAIESSEVEGIVYNNVQGGLEVEVRFAHNIEAAASVTTVPEPSSIPVLATLAATSLLHRRKKAV